MQKLDLSRIHWPQVAVLVALIAGVVLVLLFAPESVIAKLPWQVIAGGAGTAGAGVLASFLGSLIKPADTVDRASTPSTTPAAEARARLAGPPPLTAPRPVREVLPVTLDGDEDDTADLGPRKPTGGAS